MNLIIDIGNSFSKLILFKENEIAQFEKHAILEEKQLENFLKNFPEISSAMLSNVGKDQNWIENCLRRSGIKTLALHRKLSFPFEIKYLSPETLGVDRLALAAGAFASFPNQDVLVIDAGSCVTYDFIDQKNNYIGGAIAPGLQMRLKAMHHYTAKLPLIHWEASEIDLIGRNTEECMLSGTVHGIRAEVGGIIDRYKMRYPNLMVIITGGDQMLFDKDLKSGIFADAYLLAKGMNFILNYNAD